MSEHYVLIHGIRKKAFSTAHMKGLRSILLNNNIRATSVNYGYILVPITNKKALNATLETLAPHLNKEYTISLVGYSNGGWTALQVAEMGYPIDRLILISPALHSAHAFPEHVRRVDVFYCPDDVVGTYAKRWRMLTSILPWRWKEPHAYGKMMATGYKGSDPRVHNHMLPPGTGHKFYESVEALDMIMEVIEEGKG